MAVSRRRLVSIGLLLLVVCAAGLFVVDAGSAEPEPEPVPFHDTVTTGVVLENEPSPDDRGIEVPKVQVFYSQYEYVVGYRGVERFVDDRAGPRHEERFGHPIAAYVTDYSTVDVSLTEEGYPVAAGPPSWTDAESAAYVVDSDARTPAGETVVPFGNRDDAAAFAAAHGGTVVGWESLLEREFDVDDAGVVRDRVDRRHARADDRIEDANRLRERPVEVVVGEDAPTLEAAVEAAPPNSTVVVPGGVHEVSNGDREEDGDALEIDRPITLAGRSDGDGTESQPVLRGDGNGSVVVIESDHAAVVDLRIDGVGDATEPEADDGEAGASDALEMAYGRSDAGIAVADAGGVLVENVTIETPATGVLLRDAPESVVRNVSVHGSDRWDEGYMGVTAVRSPDAVVEDSRFVDGRDGIYLHRSDGIVYRNNHLVGNRIGVHLMYTSSALIADNRIEDASSTGIDLMTDPEHNAVVGNEIRDASQGIVTSGSRSYVAGNLVTGTDVGLTTGAGHSIYEGNALVANLEGMRANHLLPTNEVTGNDFVGNHEHATARLGTLRVWSEGGTGNFWHGAVGAPAADRPVLERSHSPTHPADRRLHRVDGAPTLARAPATDALSTLEGSVSGMRSERIVDPDPLCEPANPELLARADWEWDEPDRACG
ncbi:nitrous oxide reductase accessory protein NosL/NosD [Halobiforma lacisalsi AJ5]|uniref:Nitrous oxide reductase accessory protein NosL/NosD n=1 Tax=Natronobacterium lacisalsi AJ5 TaxID=358396 RepID=M0LTQ6_NATLA|nr:NosD domain-containing protein [Halobiforma lacisalsi]APW97668.1 nitrous oxide reductase accessory protein NosL/NosD [Halobiforma lacisalsi AJ5]EMA36942.1 NosL family protein [Halobiforma lacisalsi AJ5]